MRNLVLYGAIGCLASGTDALLFYLLAYLLGADPLASNCFTVLVGMAISFTLNRKFNFKVEDHAARRAAIFFAVGLAGLLLSQALLAVGSAWGLEPIAVKAASIVVVAAFQFVLNKFVSFGLDFAKEDAS